ncbi:MAG: hypothetical protein ACRCU5_05520 [Rhizobiaceae bacterium]
MRLLGILFNPFVSLFLWLTTRLLGFIDRRLGARFGWLLAWLFVAFWGVSLLMSAYGVREPAMKLTGVMARDTATIVDGRVTAVRTIESKTMTIRQEIVAEFNNGGAVAEVKDTITEPKSRERAVGDAIPVYILDDGAADLDDPNDPIFDAVITVIALLIPLLGLFFSVEYLRYRTRLKLEWEAERPAFTYDASQQMADPVIVRGKQTIKSRAERLRDEQDVVRAMYEKAERDKQNRR